VARFSNAIGEGGIPGPTGPAGADALWNFTGEWVNGIDYVAGDLVTFEGSLYYTATGVFSSYPPGYPGVDWVLAAEKGANGTSGLETSTRYSPILAATGLAFTGSGATYPTYNSYYVKAGKLVSFVIEANLSTVTNFGTGQYKLQLPFTPAVGYNHFTGWVQVDTAVNPDITNGHFIINADHAGITDVLDLHYLKQSGGANSPIIEGLLLQGTPSTLTTSSKIYINGTYIAAS